MNDLHSKMTLLYHHVMMILIQCYTCWFWVRWLLNVLYSWIFVPHINIAITLPPLTNILLDINLGYKFFFEGFILYLYMIAAYIQILDITQFSEIYSNIYIHLAKRFKRKILSTRFDFNSANSWNIYLLPYRSFIIQMNMIM